MQENRHERERRHPGRGHRFPPARPRGAAPDRRLLARGELPLGRADLPPGQPAAEGAAGPGARQAAPPGPLGHDARPEPDLRPHEPGDPELGPGRDLRDRPRPRRSGHRRQRLSRGDLQRGLPQHHPRRGGHPEALPAVLVPGRHPQPRRAGDPGLHPRGRRARLRALPRLRRGLRQPRPARLRGRRRRRGRDRPAGDQLALEQVPRTRCGTARSCRSSTSTATRSPTRPSSPASRGRSSSVADGGLRPQAVLRRGRRPGRRPPAAGGHDGRGDRGDQPDPEGGPRGRRHRAAAVADDRAPDAEGLDGPEDDRRQAGRGHLALPPGPDERGPQERGEPRHPRDLDAQLPPRGAVRRARRPASRSWRRCRRRPIGA